MSANKHIGSDFDDFLREEGMLEEVEAVAAKRVFVYQLEQEMKKLHLTKEQFARKMGTSRSAVDRLLNPNKPSTLRSLVEAARAVGKHVKLSLA